ncbi:hypothetical protein IAR50_001956 [Cryptococcus sp. DSM 104548]
MSVVHALPLAALLPPFPSAPGPSYPLPSPAYIIGPLPPTTPLHLALNHLAQVDDQACVPSAPTPSRKGKEKAIETLPKEPITAPSRVLILTGAKGGFQDCIENENEQWIREHGGMFDVIHKLKRVDMRYCPTPDHLQLYLTMVSDSKTRDPKECHQLERPPGMIILYDVAAMFLEEELLDEEPDDSESAMVQNPRRQKPQWKTGICIHDYLNLLAAARATVNHFSSCNPSGNATRLVMLEPRLDHTAALPIHDLTANSTDEDGTAKKTWKEKQIPILNGVRRIFGWPSVGIVREDRSFVPDRYRTALTHAVAAASNIEHDYTLSLDCVDEPFRLARRSCKEGYWAREGADGTEQQGGWQWAWT